MRAILRNPLFHVLWLAVEAGILAVMVRDVNTVNLVRDSSLHLFGGGDPFPIRYVPSVIFRHYPWLGIGISIGVSFIGAAILCLLIMAAAHALVRRVRLFHRDAAEETTDCPPVSQTIPPAPPTSPP